MTPQKGATTTFSTSGPGPGAESAYSGTQPASSSPPNMATMALPSANNANSSVPSLNGLTHRPTSGHSRPSTTASVSAGTRAKLASAASPTAAVQADARRRVHNGSGICDTPSSPSLAQLAKSSFSASTPNYILINKLRIQEQAINRARRTPDSLRSSSVSFAPNSSSSHSRSRLQLNHKSVTHSAHSSPTRSSAAAISPIALNRSSLSGALSSGRPNATRPVVTRITAQDWLNGSPRRDSSTARRTSKLIATNSSSISSSPCSSLHCSSSECPCKGGHRKPAKATVKSASKESSATLKSSTSSQQAGRSAPSTSNSSSNESEIAEQSKPPAPVSTVDKVNDASPIHPGSSNLRHCTSNHEEATSDSSSRLRFHSIDEAAGPAKADSPAVASSSDPSSSQPVWPPLTKRASAPATATGSTLPAADIAGPSQLAKSSKHCDRKGQSQDRRRAAANHSSRDSATVNGNMIARSSSKRPKQSIANLLAFIEKSSPELIFLLSESAKLSYHLCQFEAKLDYLEQIFCSNAPSDNAPASGKVNDVDSAESTYQTNSWCSVITRTRNWIAGVRNKNILLEKKPTKTFSQTSAFKSPTSKVQHAATAATSSNSTLLSYALDNKDDDLSSEDELIVLLDRIVKFSSSIVSKLSTDQREPSEEASVDEKTVQCDEKTTTAEAVDVDSSAFNETLNSLSAESSAKCKYEWLQSLPSNIRDLMSQLFPDVKTTADATDADAEAVDAAGTTASSGNAGDFEQIYELNPELLKALIENVKTNARLVQLRREFDRLMCSHLKSIGRTTRIRDGGHSPVGATMVPPATKPSRPQARIAAVQQPNSPPNQRTSGNNATKWKHSGTVSHCAKTKETDQLTGAANGQELSSETKLSCSANMVSDGDSGGEFTATTVTNEFAQTTDDELSSLLNQIAICSQKIIEQTGATSTSNSTTSSGCCCSSASIDAKCGGGCSLSAAAAHYGHSSHSLKQDCSHLEHPWSSPPHSVTHLKKTPNLRSANCCQNCPTKPHHQQHHHPALCGLRSQATLENLSKMPIDEHLYAKRDSFSSQPHVVYQSARHWPLGHSFDEDYLHAASVGPIYGEAATKAKTSPFHAKRSVGLSGLNEPFIDNMTGFMFSPSAMDLLSVASGHAPLGPHQFRHTGRGGQQFGSEQYALAGSMAEMNSANAFMFDPNVDVESFLNEVEKELDDNCFASAPPFLARNVAQGVSLSGQQHLEFPMSPHRYAKPTQTLNGEHHHGGGGACHHSKVSHGALDLRTPLVNASARSVQASKGTRAHSPPYSSLSAPSPRYHAAYPNHLLESTHLQRTSSLLAGGNWRLSQRHSTLHTESGLGGNSQNSHFPFPSTASMPMTGAGQSALSSNANLSESLRYKRLIVPSASRDLLDNFRVQVSNRVAEETDNQLRQVEQWFQEHVQASMGRPPADLADSPSHQLADQRRFSADEVLKSTANSAAPTENLIYFGN